MNTTKVYNQIMCAHCGQSPVWRYSAGTPFCADCWYQFDEPELRPTPTVKEEEKL